MHELSICTAIRGIVERHAGTATVETVHVRVGQLRQIVPDTLAYCWRLVTENGALAGSVLDVESVRARIACGACGEEHDVGAVPFLACRGCGATEVRIVTGEEFLVTTIDLARTPEEV